MREMSLKQMQNAELNILEAVAKFCDNNDVQYFLCGGTLLGAVRHKGFIPWDDDIDIFMLRDDYEKFLQMAKTTLIGNQYKLDCLRFGSKELSNTPFAKVYNQNTFIEHKCVGYVEDYGKLCMLCRQNKHSEYVGVERLYIDIFPVDNVPDSIFAREKQLLLCRFLRKLMQASKASSTSRVNFFIKLILRNTVLKIFSPMAMYNQLEKIVKKYRGENTKQVACVIAGYGRGERISREALSQSIELEFEGKLLKAPTGWHEYLSGLYGDYMTEPPSKKRVPRHRFTAYWIE